METTHIPARRGKNDTAVNQIMEKIIVYNDYEFKRQLIKNFIKGLTKYIFLKLLSCTRF